MLSSSSSSASLSSLSSTNTSFASLPQSNTSTSNQMDATIKDFLLQMIVQKRNSNRENLLHYTCSLNRSEIIEILLEKGCDLSQQDCQGRTPIHMAIDAGHRECIEIFQNLLLNYSSHTEKIQKQLCSLLKCYNNKGYTILHEAILRDMREFVCCLLGFCEERHIDLRDLEVLGCGDTIVHLTVRYNLLELAKIICSKYPYLVKSRNYGGQLPEEIHCITNEMKMILKAAEIKEN